MRPDDLETLDIRITPAPPGRYSVELRLGAREFPPCTIGQELLTAAEAAGPDDGVRLFAALIAGDALRSAWDLAGALHPRRRIRLRIDDAAPELHALAWETLHDPSPSAAVRFVAADIDTPFSRHVANPWEPLGPVAGSIAVLTAVAAPTGIDAYGLAPIDRPGEQALLAAACAAAPPGRVRHTALTGPCTIAALAAELERGHHVLHLVAHGAVNADRTGSVIFLERADGAVDRVDAARFARTIDCLGRSLRLVVLMSCNTAARSPTDPRFGFAPALLGAGVPAVLAMQDRIPMLTGAAFTRAFYEELWRSGEIDRAANRARRVIVTERLPGNAVPALYATGTSLQLWAPDPEDMDEPDEPDTDEQPADEQPAPGVTWEEFGGPLRELEIVSGPGDRLHAFGLDDDGVLRCRSELAPGGAWSEWQEFAADVAGFAVAADPRGRVAVFVIDGEGEIRLRSADASGRWREWDEPIGAGEQIAAVFRKDGGLVLFARLEDILHVTERRGADGPWGDWYDLGGDHDSFTVVRNGADHLVLSAIFGDGTLQATTQRRPRGEWDDWVELGTDVRSAVAVAGRDGSVHLLALGADQLLQWTFQTGPDDEWEEFTSLSDDCSAMTAARRRDGALETFIVEAGVVSTVALRDGEDNPWQCLGGQDIQHLRAVATARGEIEVFALDERGKALRLVRPR